MYIALYLIGSNLSSLNVDKCCVLKVVCGSDLSARSCIALLGDRLVAHLHDHGYVRTVKRDRKNKTRRWEVWEKVKRIVMSIYS